MKLVSGNSAFDGVDFLLSAGDQVNTASNEDQYDGYLEHDTLLDLPTATVVGNHDSGSAAYNQHFNNPNESSYGMTAAGGDYYFVYNHVLFLALNSNNTSTAEHKAFMEQAIQETEGQDITWKVVVFHHSIYSVASHSLESGILTRREELVPVFKDLDIDVVLMGHDHVYCRTYMMDGLDPMTDASIYDDADYSSITNPTGILYVTLNSASGSKFYTIKNASFPYSRVMNQENVPNISRVDVSDSQFKITTYRTGDMSVVDSFAINKKHVHNMKAVSAGEATCLDEGNIAYWYCDECGETVVAKTAPCTCPKCGGSKLTQDPDTLDTWFSSALWPFSTLGWPNEDSEDLKYFYPTNTLVTGYDIIGFWVSRMIFSGLAYTGKAPFSTVCIHGIVRDSQGRKMSKSLGNGIDPLEVIAQYGADALRFMLVDGSTPGNDMRYIEKKVEAARNFANKLWNATRFVLMNLPEDFEPGLPSEDKLDMSDKWVLTKLNQVAGAMTDNLDHYEMGLAAAKINSFIWDVYCDWFIEIAKPRLNSGDAEQADTARRVLVYVLDKALKLLHPFMPFITEELYQALPGSGESIMIQSWPTFDEAHNWAAEEEAFEKVMDYIKAVRTMRTEMNVHPAKKTSMIIETADAAPFRNAQVYLAKFAFATDVTFTEKYEGSTDGMVQVSTHAARGFIPMMELIDREKELARLNKEKAKAEKEMAMFGNQLNNPKFVERAPAALVEEIRTKFAKSQDKLANIEQSIKALG